MLFRSLAGGDLAPRDAVSRALVQRMREQQRSHLWLDLRPVGRERLEQQFPTILGRCRELGLEPTTSPIPVAPAAHYWMGGVRTDGRAATSIAGLYAVGEVASSGVHGANRLASNSLMECLVFARQLGQIELSAVAAGPASPQQPQRQSASGPVRNPHRTTHTSGGSSSGCAALVASGEVDMAIGGDQGGSIRIPAAFCGIVGMKPTWSLVPYTGILPIEPTVDHSGPMTANVADNALLLEVIAGPDGLDSRQGEVRAEQIGRAHV